MQAQLDCAEQAQALLDSYVQASSRGPLHPPKVCLDEEEDDDEDDDDDYEDDDDDDDDDDMEDILGDDDDEDEDDEDDDVKVGVEPPIKK